MTEDNPRRLIVDLDDGGEPRSPSQTDEASVVLKRRATQAPAPDDVPPSNSSRAARRLLRCAGISGGVAICAGLGWCGWMLRDRYGTDPAIVVNRTSTIVSDAPAGDGTAPSVVGLTADAARQAFADAGAPPTRIAVSSTPNAQDRGTVVAQSPEPAAPLKGQRVRLTVAAQANMPQVVGAQLAGVRKTLNALGADVEVKTAFRAGQAEGTVLEAAPAAGQRLTGAAVKLTVARAESSIALSGVGSTTGDCSFDTATLAGHEVEDVLLCSADHATPQRMVYALGARATRFSASVGIPDDADSSARMSLRVVGDGRRLADVTVTPAHLVSLSVNVTGVSTLRLEARSLTSASETVAAAHATISGSRNGIDRLPKP